MRVHVSKLEEKLNCSIIDNKPVFITVNSDSEHKDLINILERNNISLYAPIEDQIVEYQEIFTMFYGRNIDEYEQFIEDNFKNKKQVLGEFVLFNWNDKAVFNILPHKYHYELLTWRNKEKLTHAEQEIIATKSVGIIGSSVGSFISKTISKSGFQNLKIAEPKNMKPSNATRMYNDSLRDYGTHKLTPLVRGIYEFNPYSQIECFNSGVDQSNIEYFFNGNEVKLDIIIDAADDPTIKVLIREYCEKYKIPLIYGFDEKGCITIQRYDRPELNTFNEPKLDLNELALLKKEDTKKYIMKIFDFFPGGGYENLTQRQIETVDGILSKTRGGFSQLAWEAALLGSMAAKAAIDIALGVDIAGSEFVDLDEIITKNMKRIAS